MCARVVDSMTLDGSLLMQSCRDRRRRNPGECLATIGVTSTAIIVCGAVRARKVGPGRCQIFPIWCWRTQARCWVEVGGMIADSPCFAGGEPRVQSGFLRSSSTSKKREEPQSQLPAPDRCQTPVLRTVSDG